MSELLDKKKAEVFAQLINRNIQTIIYGRELMIINNDTSKKYNNEYSLFDELFFNEKNGISEKRIVGELAWGYSLHVLNNNSRTIVIEVTEEFYLESASIIARTTGMPRTLKLEFTYNEKDLLPLPFNFSKISNLNTDYFSEEEESFDVVHFVLEKLYGQTLKVVK